jgi:4-hydroxy-3-polyprenylbenzoate decarboxylase
MKPNSIVLAITGASGVGYGLRLGKELLGTGVRLTILVSAAGFQVLREEAGLDWGGEPAFVQQRMTDYFSAACGGALRHAPLYFARDDFSAPVASGSSAPDAMVVCPCTMGTLSRIACGNSATLLERCADVMVKERRPLVLVPRETPLSEIHLENMLKLARLGVRIVPAMPAFYHKPETVEDLVDFVTGRVLDTLGIDHHLYKRWDGGTELQ